MARGLTLFILSVLIPAISAAADGNAYPGYISDVSGERMDLSAEVVILPLDEDTGPTLRDKIFTEKVTKEFQTRYEERFGQTRTEQFISIPSRFFETQVQPGQYRTLDEEVSEQQRFGNYMVKRLIEVHVDDYMKQNPNARPVYELKERISNVNVQVKPGYKFKFKYSLSSNDFDISMDNPLGIRNKISMRSFDFGSPDDTLLFLGYPITSTIELMSSYSVETGDTSVSGVKRLNEYWSTSLTGSNTDLEGEKVIVGIGWRD